MNLLSPKLEIGFGSGPFDPSPIWVDITEWMWGAHSGPSMVIKRGRTAEATAITPGSASFILDNSTGAFDPENVNGPFYGQLDPFVPARISVGGQDLFRGVVEAWPVIDSGGDETVEVELVDPLGMLSQVDPPHSAFDVESQKLKPSRWWRNHDSSWTEQFYGASATTRGRLEEMEPLVDGDDKTWGSVEGEGSAVCTNPLGSLLMDTGQLFISLWVRPIWNEVEGRQDLVAQQRLTDSPIETLQISVGTSEDGWRFNHIWYWAESSYVVINDLWVLPPADSDESRYEKQFKWGETVHLAIQFPNLPSDDPGGDDWFIPGHPDTDITKPVYPRIWCNGVEYKPSGIHANHLNGYLPPPRPLPLYLGGNAAPGTSFSGALDHVQWWDKYEGSFEDGAELARQIYTAGRTAWAGHTMDQRALAILEAIGAAGLAASFDPSAIRTRHGYRSDSVLDLLQRIENTEQGKIWVDRHGQFRFSNRHWAWNAPRSTQVQATLTDNPADVGDETFLMDQDGLVRIRDSRRITTVAQVTSEHGRMQTAVAAPEIIERYGRRNTVHLSRLLHHSDEMSRSIAEWIIRTQSVPKTRVEQVRFLVDPRNLAMVNFAQTVDECDLVAVSRHGELVHGHVIGVVHSISPAGWWVTLHLDESLYGRDWFTWNESQWGLTDMAWAF